MSDPTGTPRLAAFLGLLAVMLAAETFWPARPWLEPRARRLTAHALLAALNTALTRFLVAAPLLAWTQRVHDAGWGLSAFLGLHGLPGVLATVVLFDCFDYWWHRFNHTATLLWRFHRVHHMDTHVDATTSLRFHAGELFLSGLSKAFWILFWGPSWVSFAVFESGITAFSQFHHSNIDFPDPVERRLRSFTMTPRLHAAHHTVALRTRNANYSTIFIVWDRLFGSFRREDREELKLLGLEEGRADCLGPRALLSAPFEG